jgi:hypothetical protein
LVPSEKLLEFNVKEGWGPLCSFLGKRVPEGRLFPRQNDAEQFNVGMARLRTLQYAEFRRSVGKGVAAVAAVAVLGLGVWMA